MPLKVSEDVGRALLTVLVPTIEQGRSMEVYGPEVEVADNASDFDQALGLSGRDRSGPPLPLPGRQLQRLPDRSPDDLAGQTVRDRLVHRTTAQIGQAELGRPDPVVPLAQVGTQSLPQLGLLHRRRPSRSPDATATPSSTIAAPAGANQSSGSRSTSTPMIVAKIGMM